jgi:subtilisin family serine protease
MQLKINIKNCSAQCAMALCALSALGISISPEKAAAQPLRGHPESVSLSSDTQTMTRRFRDNDVRVEVMSAGRGDARLIAASVRREGRTFRAWIGVHALVQLAIGVSAAELMRANGLQLDAEVSAGLRIYRVRGRQGEDGVDVAGRLGAARGVLAAIPDLHLARRPAAIAVPPDDPRYSAQWYLTRMQIEAAWRLTTGSRDIAVVVIDGGCDTDHPDLAANYAGGLDLVDGDDDPNPEPNRKGNAHGTACAGIIAAEADNEIGIAGVCPGCALHCVRLYGQDDVHLVPISADLAAFEYAFDVGAAVVSNSWGFADAMPVPEMIRGALERLIVQSRGGLGTLVVFAAGNENRELGDDELVAVDGVLNVGAVNNFDEAAPFSNFGASLDLTAPTGTFTTDIAGADGDAPGDYTELFGGTSSACPVVAGVAGLVASADPSLSPRASSARCSSPAPAALRSQCATAPATIPSTAMASSIRWPRCAKRWVSKRSTRAQAQRAMPVCATRRTRRAAHRTRSRATPMAVRAQ